MELQLAYEAFQEAGAELVAVAVASSLTVEGWRQDAGAAYPVLADPDHRVAESFGVYDLLGNGFATPAAFVIDKDRHIVWSHVGQHTGDRPDMNTVLEQLPGR